MMRPLTTEHYDVIYELGLFEDVRKILFYFTKVLCSCKDYEQATIVRDWGLRIAQSRKDIYLHGTVNQLCFEKCLEWVDIPHFSKDSMFTYEPTDWFFKQVKESKKARKYETTVK